MLNSNCKRRTGASVIGSLSVLTLLSLAACASPEPGAAPATAPEERTATTGSMIPRRTGAATTVISKEALDNNRPRTAVPASSDKLGGR